jgi:hypothetical protein
MGLQQTVGANKSSARRIDLLATCPVAKPQNRHIAMGGIEVLMAEPQHAMYTVHLTPARKRRLTIRPK